MNKHVKSLSKKWMVFLIISLILSTLTYNLYVKPLSSILSEISFQMTLENVFEKIKYHLIYSLIHIIIFNSFYLLSFILLFQLKKVLIPNNKWFNCLFVVYFIFCLLFREINHGVFMGLMLYGIIDTNSSILYILNWIDVSIGFVMGAVLMVTLFKKQIFTSLLGIAGLIYISRSLLDAGMYALVTHYTINGFWVKLIASYLYCFFIGFWIIMANRYLTQRAKEENLIS